MQHFYQNIKGFMNNTNTVMLDKVIEYMPQNCQWVELGAWTGKSTAYCAVELINKGKFGRFVTVDSWNGCEILKEHDLVKNNSIKDVFLGNISPIKDRLEIIESISWDAANLFQDRSLDFCYVDAGHSYEDVTKDLKVWWSKIKPNGYFGGDDYTNEFPGLVMAVNEFFSDKNITVEKIGRCWLVHKIE